MPRAKRSPEDEFRAVIGASYANVPVAELAEALGKLVKRRTAKPRTVSVGKDGRPKPYVGQSPSASGSAPRAKPRRIGKTRRYIKTNKLDMSRVGTFRRYMISIIRAHTDTASANAYHATCDNPKFAKNKLDFNWAVDNGYITWED